MKAPKFTPGPWQVVPCINPDFLRVTNSTGKMTIVNVSVPNSVSIEERDANARLIGAAPELLTALERSQDWLAKFIADRPAIDETGIKSRAIRQFDINKSILNLAKGDL